MQGSKGARVREVEISVHVKGEQAVVRKAVFDDRDRVLGKYGLSSAGQWVKVPEGEAYPPECWLRVVTSGLGRIDWGIEL